jgi:hypothetical protein
MPFRHFRHWTKKVADFTRSRPPQSDDDFLRACNLPPHPHAAHIALTVRRVFAEEGSVDPAYIHATDRYPEDLSILPSWDSIDLLDILFRLERDLHRKLPRTLFPTSVGRTVFPTHFRVDQFIHRLLDACQTQATP